MATPRQNKQFIEALFTKWPLDEALEWIQDNLSPGEVFEEIELFDFVRNHAASPEDVFLEIDLEAWAEDAGFFRN